MFVPMTILYEKPVLLSDIGGLIQLMKWNVRSEMPLPERPTKQARSKLHKATYMAKLKSDPAAYEAFKQNEALRARERRQLKKLTMTPEELLRNRELKRARQSAYRALHKAQQAATDTVQATTKPKTRSELKRAEERREKNRLSQRKRRENMSSQKKRREREWNRDYCRKKKMETEDPKPHEAISQHITPGSRRTTNYRLRKAFGTGLVVKLKNFVKSVSKRHGKVLKDVAVHYYSPTKKKGKSQNKPRDLGLVYARIKKLRSKCVLKTKRILNDEEKLDLYQRKSWKAEYAEKYFIEKSQHLPCKKTINRHLKQKKILNKNIVNLYADFIEEHGSLISRATFIRRRPKHVLPFTKTPFRQCLCEICLNPMLKAKVLNRLLPEAERLSSLKDMIGVTVCDPSNMLCVSRECRNCGVWTLSRYKDMINLECRPIEFEWTRWEAVAGAKGTRIDIVKKKGSLNEMIEEMKGQASKLPLHDFVQKWQSSQYSKLCTSLPDDWAVITVDFSENYLCQKQDQPQASYYGYSQVTVHPCVLYYNNACGERHSVNITIITYELDHSSSLVHHIIQSLKKIHKKLPSLKRIVVFSDGCSSQYKSKIPFAYTNELGKSFNVERCFFGARHGKNPCDALGGILKQAATRAVKARQVVIQNAQDLHTFASKSLTIDSKPMCREFWLFGAKESEAGKKLNLNPISIYGTRQLHSLLPTADGLKIWNLSCFCKPCREGHFDVCENGDFVSHWKSVKVWEKTCKERIKNQKEVMADAERSLNDAFLGDPGSETDMPVASNENSKVSVSNSIVSADSLRQEFFKDVLKCMSSCQTFNELKSVVASISPRLRSFPLPNNVWPTVFDCGVPVDKTALALVPSEFEFLFPVCVDVDGNCMPPSLSLAIFNSQDYHEEIRCRISIESVINKSSYLSLPERDLEMCLLSECQGGPVHEVYEREVLEVWRLGIYMGLWQLMSAATALNADILFIYPQKGQSCGQFLDRKIEPLAAVQQSPSDVRRSLIILWTSTRNDMKDEFWVANHVEPMFPLSEPFEISIAP